MAPAILSMIGFIALMVWRFVFAGPHRWPLVRVTAPRQHRRNNVLEEGLHISDPGGVAVVAGNRFENSSDDLDALDPKDRAKRYLRRIVALTGATQMGNSYVLDVAKIRFPVVHRCGLRILAMTDPRCAYQP